MEELEYQKVSPVNTDELEYALFEAERRVLQIQTKLHRWEISRRRWGHLGPGLVSGNAEKLVEYFTGLSGQGAQRFYVWFADTAPLDAIEDLGESVTGAFPH